MSAGDVEALCVLFHDAYEAAAAEAGWETQERSRKPWAEVPEANKETMRATIRVVLASDWLAADRARVRAETLAEVQVEFERMGPIWGGSAAWLTTGTNVAALAVDVVRGMAEAGDDQ